MRYPILLLLAASVLFLSQPANSDGDLTVEAYLSPSIFEACGLAKLEPEELSLLSSYLAPTVLESFEIDSAFAYMEKQGFEPLTLYAGIRVDPERSYSDLRHLAFTSDRRLILEQWSNIDGCLPAGNYLAKVGAFSVEILDLHGETRRYTIEDDD
jgi:hypothetical protein